MKRAVATVIIAAVLASGPAEAQSTPTIPSCAADDGSTIWAWNSNKPCQEGSHKEDDFSQGTVEQYHDAISCPDGQISVVITATIGTNDPVYMCASELHVPNRN